MRPPRRGRRLGIPWLGLPLGGLLAWTAVGQPSWDDRKTTGAFPPDEQFAPIETIELSPGAVEAGSRSRPAGRPADVSGELKSGETLGALLSRRLGLTSVEAQAASSAAERFVDLRQLRAGSEWRAYLSQGGRLDRFELGVAAKGDLTIERRDESWQPFFDAYRRESRLVSIRGRLDGALESSVADAGAPSELAYEMAEVLQWDIDFSRDLQPGDEFCVLFEEVRVERDRPTVGEVLAIEYGRADGRRLEAYRFAAEPRGADSSSTAVAAAGYFDGDGRPLQKMFLRSPLPYSRVTSRFSHRRLHPVLGVFRPHYGVDYGAPVGTPVRATASGTVVAAGWDGGGGRTVKVRHANDFLTAYLHLSRFATGVRSGRRVLQGDIVGFVGSSGLATAPHLDYRIQQNGRWIDPLSLKTVPAAPVPTVRLAEFRALRDAMRLTLATGVDFSPLPFAPAREAPRVAAGGSDLASPEGTSGRAPGTT